MSADPSVARPGLGTSIVEALANQLEAVVRTGDAAPGTSVEIVHSGLAVVRETLAQAV
jgi:two-component sensor histidine kinase